jgi:hypothetical protein
MRRALLIVFTLITLVVAMPTPALAFDPFSNSGTPTQGAVDCSGDAKSSAVCQDKGNGDPITGNGGLLLKITSIVSYMAGAAAIIIIIVSAIKFMTAGGDSSSAASARRTLVGAVVGLVILALAKTLITYIVKGTPT